VCVCVCVCVRVELAQNGKVFHITVSRRLLVDHISLYDACFAGEISGDYTARLAKMGGCMWLRPGPDSPAWWRVRAELSGLMQRPKNWK
jgi:hypothetical protein